MAGEFIRPADVAKLLERFRPQARLTGLERLAGSSKKGVYRITLDDASSLILYAWGQAENYWPDSPAVPGDPFSDASGADLLAASYDELAAAGVRTPRIHFRDLSHHLVDADLALVEDIPGGSLEQLMASDPVAAEEPMRALGRAIRAMSEHHNPRYGKVALVRAGLASQDRRPEDVILDRSLHQLDLAARLDDRVARARDPIAELLAARRLEVRPRAGYCLVHGELGPDHVLLTADGRPVIIDIEGLTYFDAEWEHAFLRLRFTPERYIALKLPEPDEARVAFYLLAHRISLIEGPLRIAQTDYPERDWMIDLANHHIRAVLSALAP